METATVSHPAPIVAHLTPSEFSDALAKYGINRKARWVADHCGGSDKLIHTVPAFRPRHVIPETEVLRIVGLISAS